MIRGTARRAFLCGLSGTELTPDEARFLENHAPLGIIIFARNVHNPDQLTTLINDARTAIGAQETMVLVDQEGGRVQRLAPPHWRRYPAAASFLKTANEILESAIATASLCTQLLAHDLVKVGINVSCAPVLDIPVQGADNVIGDRAYGHDGDSVTALGSAVAGALLKGGVLPVMKHIPGHGRAKADSHFALPVINTPLKTLEDTDFAPFRALSHLPIAMTAHVTLTAVDDAQPVTISKRAIETVIRGAIEFQGLLVTDDLSMKALSGSLEDRARAAFEAGCDIALHCNGVMPEMLAVAKAAPVIEGIVLDRVQRALDLLEEPAAFDSVAAEHALHKIMTA